MFELLDIQEYRDLEIQISNTQNHHMEVSPVDRQHTISYRRSTITVSLCCTVSEIFNVE